MGPPSSSTTTTTNVQVALRIRPITPQDTVSIPTRFQRIVIHGSSDTSVSVDAVASVPQGSTSAAGVAQASSANKKQAFTFDQVHDPESTQNSIYTSTAKPLIDRFIEGFNCTILAYGQTSSGKTHTMTGMDLDGDPSDPDNAMGIIPRSIAEIFDRINRLKSSKRDVWKASVKGSFIEIYNEDLIDLLSSDEPGFRRDVQIREDKEGNILWEGLREVPVRTVSDVMDLIRQGTAIRRTNETQMNAQSSRSHAIFSLTLTQKRYTGSGPPPRSSSPLPPQASPSRLARPGSMYTSPGASGRSGSPTFGRPPTPSFQNAMSRAPQHLRPHSSLGHSEDNRLAPPNGAGEWTTITSKFHFVDLAGSERLKRTAAAGERIKEGISINSGLLALGNVISALGDVSKSRITTHIPYRDSKLTRLLQDSLGGNAHTLMIACVSPVEWNVGETVNTLKYANRARNIRNRARIDEKEEGWEDVEWLQNAVVKLRKELKAIRSGAVLPPSESDDPGSNDKMSNSAKQVREQLAELQTQYVELRQRFTDRTEELTRLRREAGENMRRSGGTIGGVGRYEEIVGPVIEEYEKTISSMEAELSLNRAALRHTNDILTEKEEENALELERHAATEAYVDELRGRVAKLSERETSTEAYIQDLEEKIKGFSSNSATTSESLSALQKDLAKYKELETTNTTYIAELEARLTKSDESVLELRHAVSHAENLAEQRAHEAQALEQKLALLASDEQGWRSELEQREEKLKALEAQMKEWESVRNDTARQRERLGTLVIGVEEAKKELDDSSRPSSSLGRTRSPSPAPAVADLAQLQTLKETHAATLLDLESVTAKYKDALREISDLAAQLEEAKLHDSIDGAPLTINVRDSSVSPFTTRRKTSINRRDSNDSSASPTASPARRVFFRQAISADSLPGMARSHSQSLSLSQEFASGRSPQRLIPNNGLRHQRSESLLTGIRPYGSLQNNSLYPSTRDRSVDSLEQEIMRLQEVIREREAEIAILEKSSTTLSIAEEPHEGTDDQSLKAELSELRESLTQDLNTHQNGDGPVNDKRSSIGRLNELMRSMAQKESKHQEVVDDLTQQLQQIRRQHDELTTLSRDQALNMSNELESLRKAHEQVVQELQALKDRDAQLTAGIADATRQHNEERELLIQEHSKELALKVEQMQQLSQQLVSAPSLVQVEEVREALRHAQAELLKSQEKEESLQSDVQTVQDALAAALKDKEDTLDLKTQLEADIAKLKAENEAQLKKAREESAESLRRSDEEYYLAVSKLCSQHEETIRTREEKAHQDLDRLRSEMEAQTRQAELARQGSLAETETAQVEAIEKLQAEHTAGLTRIRGESAADLERLAEEHAKVLQAQKSDHAEQLGKLKSQHTSLLSAKQEIEESLERLQAELQSNVVRHEEKIVNLHAAREGELQAVQTRVQELEVQVSNLKGEHESALQTASEKHDAAQEQLVQNHVKEISQLRLEHQNSTSELEARLLEKDEARREAVSRSKDTYDRLLAEEQERHQAALRSSEAHQVSEKTIWEKDRELLAQELASLKQSLTEVTSGRHQLQQEKEELMRSWAELHKEHEGTLKHLTETDSQQKTLTAQVTTLQRTQEETLHALKASEKRAQGAQQAAEASERALTAVSSLKVDLQKAMERAEQLSKEKTLCEGTIRDLQTQLANTQNRLSASLAQEAHHRPQMERTLSHPRPNGLPPAKLPPLSPPPSMPPPPLPAAITALHSETGHASISSVSSRGRQSSGSQDTHETIPTSTGSVNGIIGEELPNGTGQTQTQLIEEQETMIKTLNKQLAHCESDLQAQIDLVSTLESSLNDSERNLRKARQQANENTRERESISRQLDASRGENRDLKRQLATAQQAVIEQTQSLESRLDEERRAKDRARAQLDARMEELQKRKSKFACM